MSYFTPFFIRGSHKSYSSYRLQMHDSSYLTSVADSQRVDEEWVAEPT